MKPKVNLTQKQKKTLAILCLAFFILFSFVIIFYIGKPLIEFSKEPDKFRSWIEGFGFFSSMIYILIVIMQVIIAILPGEPFEIAGGYAFGFIEGTILCTVATTIGSLTVFLLVKKFGMKLINLFFSQDKLDKIKFLHYSKKRDLLFMILFIIPGTPKDILSYFAGVTDMKIATWLIICSLGRLPSLITSTLGGDALGSKKYIYAAITFCVTLIISVSGLVLYNKICENNNKKP